MRKEIGWKKKKLGKNMKEKLKKYIWVNADEEWKTLDWGVRTDRTKQRRLSSLSLLHSTGIFNILSYTAKMGRRWGIIIINEISCWCYEIERKERKNNGQLTS
jgi:hypothetical protein